MKCILHIGTEKTATTTLQEWLYANRGELAKQGVALSNRIGQPNNRELCAYFQSSFDDYFLDLGIQSSEQKDHHFRGFLEGLSEEIESLGKSHDCMIVTSEHFHSRLTDEHDIRRLHAYLKKQFSELKVVCYFREQSEVRRSLYSTIVKGGGLCPIHEFDDNVNDESPYYNYYMMLSTWAHEFGIENIEAVLFDQSKFIEGDIRRDFISRLDVTIEASRFDYSIRSSNERISYLQSLLLRGINKAFPRYSDAGVFCQTRDDLVSRILSIDRFSVGDIEDARAAAFYQVFDESNRQFFSKFFGVDKNLFSPPIGADDGQSPSRLCSHEDQIVDGICQLFKTLPFLKDPDADVLRDLALKYESASTIDRDEALKLMGYAHMARPSGALIKRKLQEWASGE